MLYPREKLEEELNRISKKDLEILLAVEKGMKSHEFVPKSYILKYVDIDPKKIDYYLVDLVDRGLLKILKTRNYVGFQLTYLGYDILGFTYLLQNNIIKRIGEYIETGKEADILNAETPEGEEVILKVYHIGRTSFYKVWRHRIYIVDKSHITWQYVSYLTAKREFEITKEIYEYGIPTAKPIFRNRNIIVYEKIKNAKELGRVKSLLNPETLFNNIIDTYAKVVNELEYVHGDFNAFNVLITPEEKFYIIDWGQAIKIYEKGAKEILKRELSEFIDFFVRKFKLKIDEKEVFKKFKILNL